MNIEGGRGSLLRSLYAELHRSIGLYLHRYTDALLIHAFAILLAAVTVTQIILNQQQRSINPKRKLRQTPLQRRKKMDRLNFSANGIPYTLLTAIYVSFSICIPGCFFSCVVSMLELSLLLIRCMLVSWSRHNTLLFFFSSPTAV